MLGENNTPYSPLSCLIMGITNSTNAAELTTVYRIQEVGCGGFSQSQHQGAIERWDLFNSPQSAQLVAIDKMDL